MFWRIFRQLFRASRGRLTVALIAVSSGAAISSALLNINLDAKQKLTHEFRTLGANVVVAPPSAGSDAALADAAVMDRIVGPGAPRIVAPAPYLYIVSNAGAQPLLLPAPCFYPLAMIH